MGDGFWPSEKLTRAPEPPGGGSGIISPNSFKKGKYKSMSSLTRNSMGKHLGIYLDAHSPSTGEKEMVYYY